jgi:hypothetical protein
MILPITQLLPGYAVGIVKTKQSFAVGTVQRQ